MIEVLQSSVYKEKMDEQKKKEIQQWNGSAAEGYFYEIVFFFLDPVLISTRDKLNIFSSSEWLYTYTYNMDAHIE